MNGRQVVVPARNKTALFSAYFLVAVTQHAGSSRVIIGGGGGAMATNAGVEPCPFCQGTGFSRWWLQLCTQYRGVFCNSLSAFLVCISCILRKCKGCLWWPVTDKRLWGVWGSAAARLLQSHFLQRLCVVVSAGWNMASACAPSSSRSQ